MDCFVIKHKTTGLFYRPMTQASKTVKYDGKEFWLRSKTNLSKNPKIYHKIGHAKNIIKNGVCICNHLLTFERDTEDIKLGKFNNIWARKPVSENTKSSDWSIINLTTGEEEVL